MEHVHVEFERKFLLKSLPPIPPDAEVWIIQQGYLARAEPDDGIDGASHMNTGRLRRISYPDHSVKYFHTIKTGVGVSRIERERELSVAEFERAWPRTAERRLSKTRSRIREGALVWEIDVFDAADLALAEVELQAADQPIQIPRWLQPHILREVTHDAEFTNASIARRLHSDKRAQRPA